MHYHNITKDDMLNGDGLRAVLWVAGCSHHCKNCQNPITWDENGGLEFDAEAERELFEALSKPYISGLTLSGGDPLFEKNRPEIQRIIEKARTLFPRKTIWLYTGYLWEEIKDLEYIRMLDVVVDGKFVEDEKDVQLFWKGSKNQRVINVPKTLAANKIIIHCPEKDHKPKIV